MADTWKDALDRYSLERRIEVQSNGQIIYLSPFELQIAYKLYLGSEKDLEDARFLYKLLKEYLDKSLLKDMLNKLNISLSKFRKVVGEELE